MPANDRQHGGTHYKVCGIEPWDYIAINGLGFFEGTAIKYLTRWRDKGGIEDLEKARHYVDKLIEIEKDKKLGPVRGAPIGSAPGALER